MTMRHFSHHERGSALLYAMLTMSVMLAIGLTLNSLFLNKFKSASQERNSMIALYAADSAVEMCLYEARTPVNQPALVFDNGATIQITNSANQADITDNCSVLGSASFGFRATGTYRGVRRTLEISQ
jgi:hypothetical protein